MSVTVEYSFNADADPASLVKDLSGVLGCSLGPTREDPDDLYGRCCGMEFSLSVEHGLQNNKELNFEDYRYQLDTRTPNPDAHLRPIQVEVMAIVAYVLHTRLDIHDGMLSYEVQRVLAKYRLVDGKWIDLVSQQVVEMPQHLQDVRHRVRSR